MKAIIRRWTSALFTEDVKTKLALTERQVFQAATLQELDDVYTRKLAGFESVTGRKETFRPFGLCSKILFLSLSGTGSVQICKM
jgi:hypothetical protein